MKAASATFEAASRARRFHGARTGRDLIMIGDATPFVFVEDAAFLLQPRDNAFDRLGEVIQMGGVVARSIDRTYVTT